MRLSSALGISPSHCEHPGLFFLLLPCSPSLALGWPFGFLNFALHVAGTSPCLECSSLLFGIETVPGGHICQQDQPGRGNCECSDTSPCDPAPPTGAS